MTTLLLVEDNEMNRDMLSRRLTRAGYEVLLAVDGEEGLALAQQKLPALILMDMSLPGIDGWSVLRGIRAVAKGETFLYAEAAAALVDSLRKRSMRRKRSETLGRREREVLQLLAGGKSSAQIADTLFIATGTVEVHRRNIMRKLDLHNVADLTRYAIREGLASA